MNIDHLADALDYWKGCIIKMLKNHWKDLHVIPMFTDEDVAGTWDQKRCELYARLLQVSPENILQAEVRFTALNRSEYFADLVNVNDNDLFVDPDTGIAPPSGGDTRHIRPADISQLLQDSGRVVMIYQHSSREDNWTDACVQRVVNHDKLNGCFAFAYWAGSASMIFVSRDRNRLDQMRAALDELVGVLPNHLMRVTALVPESSSCP